MARRNAQVPGATSTADVDQSAGTTSELPETPAPTARADLPNAIDIDPKAIRAPVLTKQGWVCPDESERRTPDALRA